MSTDIAPYKSHASVVPVFKRDNKQCFLVDNYNVMYLPIILYQFVI